MNQERLHNELEAMTVWVGEAPAVWERALARCDADPVAESRQSASMVYRWVFGSVAAAALLAVTAGAILPTLGKARVSRRAVSSDAVAVAPGYAMEPARDPAFQSLESSGGFGVELEGLKGPQSSSERRSRAHSQTGNDQFTGGGVDTFGSPNPPVDGRSVVRKATIEIASLDVRADAIRVQQLLSGPRGEYVESADINERDQTRPRADLVLRVEAGRLGELLSELREFGVVESERIDTEDVTEQMVDLGARLESERRVEAELLELLASRPDDSLEDVLVARRELHAVRERIERTDAQRQYLGQLVRLARVAVMLRSKVLEEEPAERASVWKGFVEDIGEAWRDGVAGLLGSVAWLVRVAVGGAVWFVVLAAAALFARRLWQREHPSPLAE